MNQIKPFIDNFGKQFFIGVSLLGMIFTLKFLEINNVYSFIPSGSFFLLILVFLIFYKNPKFDITSNKWFEKIKYELENTSSVIIYLKDFSHPDQAKEIHREDILKIMTQFARLIYEYKDEVKIMAYRPVNTVGTLPTVWIKNKIREFDSEITEEELEKLVANSISIINRQPHSNKYSFYLFDKNKLLYSLKNENNGYKYFSIDLESSIIPHFLKSGFDNLKMN
jgi:hypothetical protein